MSNVAILYHSEHHGNTKKLVDAISRVYAIDLIAVPTKDEINLSQYSAVGFASGIFMSQMHQSLFDVLKSLNGIYKGKKAFLIFTSGTDKEKYADSLQKSIISKGFDYLGMYHCLGYDTYGPWKLIGGIAKGHPTDNDMLGAVQFYEQIVRAGL